jgi:hypothetical protein
MKSTSGGMVFLLELPAHEIHHRRNGFPPGIASSWMLIQAGKINGREKSSAYDNNSRISNAKRS